MRPVGDIVRVDLPIRVYEVEAVDIVDEAVAVIVDTFLTIELLVIGVEVVLEVGVLGIDTAVCDSDDDVTLTRLRLPGLEETDVSTGNAPSELTRIVVVPLVWEQGVIEGSCGLVRTAGIADSHRLRLGES